MWELDWLKTVLAGMARWGLVGTFTAVVSALTSALVTSWLAYRNFRHQRWWERRADAYTRLIEALVDLSNYYETVLEIEGMQQREIPKDRKHELEVARKQAERQLLRAKGTGAFLFSGEVIESLRALGMEQDKDHGHYFTYLDENGAAVGRCLKQVISASQRDLRVPNAVLRGRRRRDAKAA